MGIREWNIFVAGFTLGFALAYLMVLPQPTQASQAAWYLDDNGVVWAGTGQQVKNLGSVTELHDVDGIKYQLNDYGNTTLDPTKQIYQK